MRAALWSVGVCDSVCVSHTLQSAYVGNTVCRPRTDEREEVGGREVENKRNAPSDLSDCLHRTEEKKRGRRGGEWHVQRG